MVEQVRLGEPEGHVLHDRAQLSAKGERFAKTQEIIGRIIESDKTPGNSRNPAVQTDRVLSALLDLQRDVDRVGIGITLDVGGLLLLQGLEIPELVQAENADVPQIAVEHIAFVQQQLAADHFVARRGVAREIDAANEELLPFIARDRQVHLAAGRIAEIGFRHKIDVPEAAVYLPQILQTFSQLIGGEDVAFLHTEGAHQHAGLAEELHPYEVHRVQIMEAALFDRNPDIRVDAGLLHADDRQAPAATTFGNDLDAFVQDLGGEISLVLVSLADLLFVVLELVLVERLRKQVLKQI